MKVNMKKLAVVITIVAIVTLVGATLALSGEYTYTKITGKYAFTGTEFCFPSSGGFGFNGGQGVFNFHWNGTYSLESIGAAFSYGSNFEYVGKAEVHGTGTYTISSGGAITLIMDEPGIVATYVTGPAAGKTFMVYPKNFMGYISADRMTITFGNVEPETETVYNSDGSVHGTQVCTSSRVAVRIW
jgi:hypothetical protein